MADQVMIGRDGAGAEVSLRDGRRLGLAEYGDPDGVPCFYFHFAPGSRLDPAVLFARCPAALAGIRLADPQLRPLVIADLTEAVIRPGTRGLVDEMALYARPWGFRLDQITVPVHLWHGDSDVSAPTALARAAAAVIPACQAVLVPGGHTAPFGHLQEILRPVREVGERTRRREASQ